MTAGALPTEREEVVAAIDQVLAFKPEHGGTGAVTQVCALMKACIARIVPPGSLYREMADEVPMPSGKGYGREDMRLRGILNALREDIVTGRTGATGDSLAAAQFDSPTALPSEQAASRANASESASDAAPPPSDSSYPAEGAVDESPVAPMPHADPEIVTALETMSADFAACYKQALRDLADPNRESFVGVVSEMREVLTAVLHALAPDDRVQADPSFRPEPKTNGPTRVQRVRYILSSRSTKTKVAEEAFDEVERRLPHLARELYARASRGTHLAPTDRRELLTMAGYWQSLLRDLLLV